MYRCKECGAEFDIKPDYCDCGNDEFEFVGKEPTNPASDIRIVDIEETAETMEKQSVKPAALPKPQPAPQFKSYNEQTAYKPSVDKISLSIFCLCLILSMYVIFFAWNPKEDNNTITANNRETAAPKNIPSIDKFWNNTPPKPQLKQAALSPSPQPSSETENKIIPQTVIKTEPQKVQKQQNVQPKVTVVPLKKTTQQKSKPKTTTSNTQKSTTTKTTSQAAAQSLAEQQKKATEAQAKQKAEQERKAAEAAQLKKLQEEQAKKAAEAKAKQEAANKQALASYKANLRNALGRKIDFTKVIGDGSCTVAFRIDQNGKLINRSFAKQSTNNTLNDAVYAAVMSTPVFNPPPAGYKNEILNLNIRFYNGNFEISLP